ncbi:hypothetical protein K505DRAFT_326743 [Melanomma pulvis-pyrius CBS 109.77]|uniref:Uncharacterized protein n=1 Tax=Melanomma pulvis-pyrius CBS 109.77 TaxID=1314802 RepID=A0A6A6X6Q8_9PLEO|nr:hypothetical protein K505DRAFT_326743 [Melanomma pulvis-pyrius CBS 109.77]
MVHFTSSILFLTAFAAAEDITTSIWMSAPPVTYSESVQYSGSVVDKDGDHVTMVLTGSVIGPEAEQKSLDSYYDLQFNKQATRFTFSGTTAFEYKSAWANGMYVNINRCWEYASDPNYPTRCRYSLHYAWLETLCSAWGEGRLVPAADITTTTVDDVGSIWTISGPNPIWTESCTEGNNYISEGGSGMDISGFASFPVLITAGAEKLTAATAATAAPTPTDAPMARSTSSAANESEGVSSTSPQQTSSESAGNDAPRLTTGSDESSSLSSITTVSTQTTSSGVRNTPMIVAAGAILAFLFVS